MFYLRTGGNGSGKTLLTLRDVRDLQLATGRPVAYNIRPADYPDAEKASKPYSNLKPETIAEFGWVPYRFEEWAKQPDNTIFIVDECHYDLPKGGTAAPPRHIAELTEHRSRGFDFFLLTQHPSNINVFARKLVQAPGWHQHIKRLGGALPVANVIQWDAVNLSCEQAGSGKSGEVKTRPYPREVYDWYTSATLHTGKVRIPKQVFVLLACVVAIPVLIYLTMGKLPGMRDKDKKATPEVVASGAATPSQATPLTPAQLVAAHRPRIEGLQHTAPLYDKLTEPKRVPVPAACVQSKSSGCKCYTQDATTYYTTDAICRQIVAHGMFYAFSPNGQDNMANAPQNAPTARSESAPSPAPTLVVLDGPGARDTQSHRTASR